MVRTSGIVWIVMKVQSDRESGSLSNAGFNKLAHGQTFIYTFREVFEKFLVCDVPFEMLLQVDFYISYCDAFCGFLAYRVK